MKPREFFIVSFLSFIVLGIFGCFMVRSDERKNQPQASPLYPFSRPTAVLSLPDTLREISGLTFVDQQTVGCVQDENGILFLYDLSKQVITRQVPFGENGDYEGLAKVGNDMYILRSDGMLFRIRNYDSKRTSVDSIATGIPAANNEGLCYDKAGNRLLIASKTANSKENKTLRMVHGFDVSSRKLDLQPVFTFDVHTIKQFARQNNIQLPVKQKKNSALPEPVVRFKPSAICIHPVTNKLYMLSAADHMLFVFSPAGVLEEMEVLDKVVFNKSEGICFLPDGTLLISNEGQENKPTILRFAP